MAESVLITGASGRIGTYLRSRLCRNGRRLRLLDVRQPEPLAGEEPDFITASVTDASALNAAAEGMDAIIHLAGIPNARAAWPDILHANITGTTAVFEAARLAQVPRIVFASSNHAAGWGEYREESGRSLPRPDSYYGVSKVFGEALGSLYHDQYGMQVVCLRIGSCFDRPTNPRMLRTWLSPDDTGRLFEAALSHPEPGFAVVWGVSNNRDRTWPLDSAIALGYTPQDDAADHYVDPDHHS